MKKIFFLGLFFGLIHLNLYSQSKNQIAIVGFYNLENLYDTLDQDYIDDEEFTSEGKRNYTSEIYRDKLSHLSQVISEMGIDKSPDGLAILGVAEIENRTVINDLVHTDKLKDRGYKLIHYDSKDARGVDVGLIYNPKYFKVISSKKIPVDLSEFGGGNTRDVLYAHGLLLGQDLHIMVGHWPSRRGGEEISMARRCKAAKVMREQMDSILVKNPNAKVIVMGDLNDDPTSPSVVECLYSSNDIDKINPTQFFNPFNQYYSKGIGTLAFNESWNLFDQILVSNGLLKDSNGLQYKNAFIFSKKYMIQMDGKYKGYPLRTFSGDLYQAGYSDHFPTYILLTKPIQ